MISPHVLKIGEETIRLDDVAWKQFANFLGFSVKSLEKASDELKMATFNHFIEQNETSDAVVQKYRGQAEKFYRADRPILPVSEILQSVLEVGSYELGELGDFEVIEWRNSYDKMVIDTLSDNSPIEWMNIGYSLRCGVRLIINVDGKSSSYVETLLQLKSKSPKSEPFYLSIPLPEKRGKIISKGRVSENIVEQFHYAAGDALLYSIDLSNSDLQALWCEPMSDTEPKIDSVLEGAKIPKTVQPKVKARIRDEYLDFTKTDRLSELEAILVMGEQSVSLGKSRMKMERHLGELVAMGGDQVIVCGCCEQRLPQEKIEENQHGV